MTPPPKKNDSLPLQYLLFGQPLSEGWVVGGEGQGWGGGGRTLDSNLDEVHRKVA